MKRFWTYGFIWIVFLFALHCANPIAPTGGIKDEIPPQIDSLKSTTNFETNFEKQRIELTFDEWIKLQDATNQIVVSPPLERDKYEVTLRGKTIRFEFKDDTELKDSVTYTINFGESIQDITESNKLTDYRFVFSTGDYIDSLTLVGIVLDSETEEPVEGATILMHENLHDSIIFNDLPLYFGKTNEQGQFNLQNLKAGTFKVVAILEEGLPNYNYAPFREKIGFVSNSITLPDTAISDLHFHLFTEVPPLDLRSHTANRFVTKLIFNIPPDSVSISNNQDTTSDFEEEIRGDTIYFWHRNITYPLEIFTLLSEGLDTTSIEEDTSWAREFPLKLKSKKLKSGFYYQDSVALRFNQPVVYMDSSLIQLTDTAQFSIPYTLSDGIDKQMYYLNSEFRQSQEYKLTLLPGSVQGYHATLEDTLTLTIKTANNESFGTIILSMNDLDSTQQYIVQLKRSEDVVYEDIVHDLSRHEIRIAGMKTGSYVVKVIEDRNRNGQWDTGNYLNKRYPEKVSNQELSNLKANWEMNVTFNWKRSSQ